MTRLTYTLCELGYLRQNPRLGKLPAGAGDHHARLRGAGQSRASATSRANTWTRRPRCWPRRWRWGCSTAARRSTSTSRAARRSSPCSSTSARGFRWPSPRWAGRCWSAGPSRTRARNWPRSPAQYPEQWPKIRARGRAGAARLCRARVRRVGRRMAERHLRGRRAAGRRRRVGHLRLQLRRAAASLHRRRGFTSEVGPAIRALAGVVDDALNGRRTRPARRLAAAGRAGPGARRTGGRLMADGATTIASVPLLEVRDVVVRFGGIVALDGVSFGLQRGRDSGPDRPQRRRQDHALQLPQPALHAGSGGEILYSGTSDSGSPCRTRCRWSASAAHSRTSPCSTG